MVSATPDLCGYVPGFNITALSQVSNLLWAIVL